MGVSAALAQLGGDASRSGFSIHVSHFFLTVLASSFPGLARTCLLPLPHLSNAWCWLSPLLVGLLSWIRFGWALSWGSEQVTLDLCSQAERNLCAQVCCWCSTWWFKLKHANGGKWGISTKVGPLLLKYLLGETSEAETPGKQSQHLIATLQKCFYVPNLFSASAFPRTFLVGLKHFAAAEALVVDKMPK